MRWKRKIDKQPEGGDRRSRRVFAWKPVPIGDTIVWLETYLIEEVYFQPAGGNPGWWSEISRHTLDYYC